ncbi:alpha/beta hydrolase [soil metagenome]
MQLDPELAPLAFVVLPDFSDVAELRSWYDTVMTSPEPLATSPAVEWVDRKIPGPAGAPDVTVRIYRPHAPAIQPAMVYYHSGSVVMGDLDTEHVTCLHYAEHAECTVVSVDYRLAPEHPYPGPVEDCYSALVWTAEHAAELGIDPDRLAVGGSSSGGTLAAAVALMARDRGGPALVFQMLVYPALDDRLDTTSMHSFVAGTALTQSRVGWMWKHYLGDLHAETPAYAAPARATDLTGLPRAYVEVGALDPLRDECIAYGARLLAADVPTDIQVIAGAPHAFEGIASAKITQRAFAERVALLRTAFGTI